MAVPIYITRVSWSKSGLEVAGTLVVPIGGNVLCNGTAKQVESADLEVPQAGLVGPVGQFLGSNKFTPVVDTLGNLAEQVFPVTRIMIRRDLAVRLMVSKQNIPPGFSTRAISAMARLGSLTCSSTSTQTTTSKYESSQGKDSAMPAR